MGLIFMAARREVNIESSRLDWPAPRPLKTLDRRYGSFIIAIQQWLARTEPATYRLSLRGYQSDRALLVQTHLNGRGARNRVKDRRIHWTQLTKLVQLFVRHIRFNLEFDPNVLKAGPDVLI